jgi:hypothetical protein
MEQEELNRILELHEKWLNGEEDGERADLFGSDLRRADLSGFDLQRADLSGSNLQRADLTYANLSDANLSGANLSGANLSGADIDYSCWPLWCGSLDVNVDKRIAAQLLYHFCRLVCEDEEVRAVQQNISVVNLANQFHRIGECAQPCRNFMTA